MGRPDGQGHIEKICIIYSFYFPNHCENIGQKPKLDFIGVL